MFMELKRRVLYSHRKPTVINAGLQASAKK
jgi:hypothetical protein